MTNLSRPLRRSTSRTPNDPALSDPPFLDTLTQTKQARLSEPGSLDTVARIESFG